MVNQHWIERRSVVGTRPSQAYRRSHAMAMDRVNTSLAQVPKTPMHHRLQDEQNQRA
jgi:hypothetical protein